MRKSWGRIGIYAGGIGLLAGGAGLSLAPAALASTGQPAAAAPAGQHHRAAAALRHVSPFGLAGHRSARHATGRAAAAPAGAPATTTVLWVSNTAPVSARDTSCAAPGYSTISSALTVAPAGATINVCGGTYTEQLAITQAVTLQAKGAVTVQGPASPSSSLTACDADGGSQPNVDEVDICGAVAVNISGFTIDGNWAPTGCYDSIYGVAVLGGADLTMSRSTVENVGGDPLTDGCQGGVGIEVGLATSGTTADPGTATLTNDTVESYAKNGITVDGAGSHAKITGATVTGAGPTTAIAQNGIQVSDNATATITGGAVSGDECDDPSACGPNGLSQSQATGLLMFDSGKVTVTGTTVSSSDLGIYNVEDYQWAYYTPPSPFVPVPVSFTRMGLDNRYENAGFDAGTSSLTSSDLSGGQEGIEVLQYTGQAAPPQVTVTGNTITNASADAILVNSDQASGDQSVQLTATGNTLDTSNAGGVANDSTSVVNVEDNWWGDAAGPSGWNFGTGSSVTSDANFFPWYTDSAMTTPQTCTKGLSKATVKSDVVLCATPGTKHANLANLGSGDVLLIANNGRDNLAGSASGETWIIGGATHVDNINGNGGTGFIQERGMSDTLTGTGNYTVAQS